MRPAPQLVEAPQEGWVQLCVFFVGAEEYAVDIMRVDEILQPQQVTPFPRAPAFVEGAINLRGAILPVVNLRRRLAVDEAASGPRKSAGSRLKPKLLVCWLGRRRVALAVDGVTGVVRLRQGEIKPPPPLLIPGARPYVVGVCGPQERLRLLLDVKALLAEG